MRADYLGPALPAPTRKPRRGGRRPRALPLHPPPAVGAFAPRPPAGPPKSLRERRLSTQARSAKAQRDARGLFPQCNPSAAGRALVLITPHSPPPSPAWPPASPPPPERFPAASRNVASPNPATHIWRALAATGPAPSRRRSYNCGCGGRAESHASLRRPTGSAPVAYFPARLTSCQGPHAEPEGEVFRRGLKPEAAFLAEGLGGRSGPKRTWVARRALAWELQLEREF